jgi:hypothetical protein
MPLRLSFATRRHIASIKLGANYALAEIVSAPGHQQAYPHDTSCVSSTSERRLQISQLERF